MHAKQRSRGRAIAEATKAIEHATDPEVLREAIDVAKAEECVRPLRPDSSRPNEQKSLLGDASIVTREGSDSHFVSWFDEAGCS